MRILAYNWRDLAHPLCGGAEVYIQSVGRQWVEQGHEVTLFCASARGAPAESAEEGVRILRRGGRLGVYSQARRYWEEEASGAFDLVVDCVNTRPFMCPRFVRGTPVVAVVHQIAGEVWSYETPWPVSAVGRRVLEPVWLRRYREVPVVTASESSRQSLAAFGLRRVTVVPEGWAPPRGGDRLALEKEGSPTVLFVGRLSANKRPDEALKAFGLLRRSVPEARLWVIGSGPMEQRLRREADDHVTFFGRVSEEEKFARMARAHVLVATSVREGWGLVVTEAAQVGTPTVAYDVAGLRDSVSVSGGALVAPDPRSLAQRLGELFEAGSLRGAAPVAPRGVAPWAVVARRILEVAGVADRATERAGSAHG